MKWSILFAAMLACVAGYSVAQAAGTAEDSAFQKRIFGKPLAGDKRHACFKRVYDAAHLTRHPLQNVRTMTLLVTGSADDPAQPAYTLGLGVAFRKSGARFETYGDCGSIGRAGATADRTVAHCGVDCDGGSIDVTLKNATSVLVAIPDGARISKVGSNIDPTESDEGKRFGPDDALFRLDRTALTDCLSLTSDEDDKKLLRRGQ